MMQGPPPTRVTEDDPESIPTKDLSLVAGIMLDKVSNYEGWRNRLHAPSATAASVADRLAQLEGKLTITVERTPPVEHEPTRPAAPGGGQD